MAQRLRYLVLGLLALGILSGVTVLLFYRPPAAVITILPAPPTLTLPPSATPSPVKVYVTGAVVNPGSVFTLPPNSRVQDAVTAAGGLTLDADIARINMAALVRDGDQIDVPLIKASKPGTSSDALPTASGPIHINTATAADLERLPGVGPSLAKAIIDYRNKNGKFKSMADLDNVSGIGPSKISQWADLIIFD